MSNYDLNVPGSWQAHCTAALLECTQLGPHVGSRTWLQKKRDLELIARIIIADVDLSGLDLRTYSFFRIYIARVNFQRCDLRDCDFRQCIMRSTQLSEADISGANFRLADLAEDVVLLEMHHDDRLDFGVRSGRFPQQIDILLKDIAENEWRKSGIHRNKSLRGLYNVIIYIADYGESFHRLFYFAVSVTIIFSAIYFVAAPAANHSVFNRICDSVLNSARYFLALSDPYENLIFALSVVGTVEAAIGYFCLALLVSMIARKILIVR